MRLSIQKLLTFLCFSGELFLPSECDNRPTVSFLTEIGFGTHSRISFKSRSKLSFRSRFEGLKKWEQTSFPKRNRFLWGCPIMYGRMARGSLHLIMGKRASRESAAIQQHYLAMFVMFHFLGPSRPPLDWRWLTRRTLTNDLAFPTYSATICLLWEKGLFRLRIDVLLGLLPCVTIVCISPSNSHL